MQEISEQQMVSPFPTDREAVKKKERELPEGAPKAITFMSLFMDLGSQINLSFKKPC